MKQKPIIAADTITPIMFELYCRLIKIADAIIHNMKPAKGIILFAVDMLSKLSTFTKIKVAIAVIIKPTGCCQSLARK